MPMLADTMMALTVDVTIEDADESEDTAELVTPPTVTQMVVSVDPETVA